MKVFFLAIVGLVGCLMPSRGSAAAVIDLQSLGLVCDGLSDNAQLFHNVYLKTQAASGSEIIFPASQKPCLTSEPLVISSNTKYYAPADIMLAPTANSVANPILIRADKVTNVLVQGITFVGSEVKAELNRPLGIVFHSTNVVFKDTKFQNSFGIGLVFSSSIKNSGVISSSFSNLGNLWKKTNRMSDQKQGLVFCCEKGNLDNFVKNSSFSDIGLDAISFANQNGFVASGNKFVSVGSGRAGITGDRVDAKHGMSGGAAIYGAESSVVQITDNNSNGAGGNGFDLFHVSNANISDNVAVLSGGNGISYALGHDAKITGNTLSNNNQANLHGISAPQAGLFISSGNEGLETLGRISIVGNSISDTQHTKTQNYGIQFRSKSTKSNTITIEANHVFGNKVAPSN